MLLTACIVCIYSRFLMFPAKADTTNVGIAKLVVLFVCVVPKLLSLLSNFSRIAS
jgi:hypothetical protein